jgi:hypothetical protein
MLNNHPVTVVGVLPESFDFASVFAPGIPVDVFIPWPLADPRKPSGNTLKVVGRLKPGATVESAKAEFALLGKQLVSQHPERNDIDPRGRRDVDRVREPFQPAVGKVGPAAQRNDDADRAGSGPFAPLAADAY